MRRKQSPIPTLSSLAFQEQLEPKLGAPQNSRHINFVARFCSRAAALESFLGFSKHHDIERDRSFISRASRRIASGEPHSEKFARPNHSGEHSVEPGPGAFGGQSQTQKEKARSRAHGHHIACGSSESFVADRRRRVFVDQEMRSLQELVARDDPIPASRMDQRGIVTDTKPQRATLGRWNAAPNPLNQLVFENSQWRVVLEDELYSSPDSSFGKIFRTARWLISGGYSGTVQKGTSGQLDKIPTLAQVNTDSAFG